MTCFNPDALLAYSLSALELIPVKLETCVGTATVDEGGLAGV
jgi:hypothetical protein